MIFGRNRLLNKLGLLDGRIYMGDNCHPSFQMYSVELPFLNTLPKDKILDMTKLKRFTDNKNKHW